MRTYASLFLTDFRSQAMRLPAAFREKGPAEITTLVAGAACVAGFLFFADEPWSGAGPAPFGERWVPLAKALGFYGELHWIPLFTAVAIWIAGVKFDRSDWRRAAVAALLAAVMAGVVAATMKGVVGRPRPDLHRPFELLGPNMRADTQGFPSGHTSHCTAFAFTLLLLVPELGFPALIIPGAVIWARLALHKHYPSDIAGGATLGMLGAIAASRAARAAAHIPLKTVATEEGAHTRPADA